MQLLLMDQLFPVDPFEPDPNAKDDDLSDRFGAATP